MTEDLIKEVDLLRGLLQDKEREILILKEELRDMRSKYEQELGC